MCIYIYIYIYICIYINIYAHISNEIKTGKLKTEANVYTNYSLKLGKGYSSHIKLSCVCNT